MVLSCMLMYTSTIMSLIRPVRPVRPVIFYGGNNNCIGKVVQFEMFRSISSICGREIARKTARKCVEVYLLNYCLMLWIVIRDLF